MLPKSTGSANRSNIANAESSLFAHYRSIAVAIYEHAVPGLDRFFAFGTKR